MAKTFGAAPRPLTGDGWHRGDVEHLADLLTSTAPSGDDALHLAHQWLIIDPPQIYELRAGRRIGADAGRPALARAAHLAGVRAGHGALALAARSESARAVERVDRLHHQLAAHAGTAAVDDFDAAYRVTRRSVPAPR